MASSMRYTALTATACCMSTELETLASGSNATGSAFDNSASHYLYADFELFWTYTASQGATPYASLYLSMSLDGTNYSYGAAGIDPPPNTFVGCFTGYAAASGTAYRVIIPQVSIPNLLFQPVLSNDSASGTFTAGSNIMRIRFYNQEIV